MTGREDGTARNLGPDEPYGGVFLEFSFCLTYLGHGDEIFNLEIPIDTDRFLKILLKSGLS